MCDNDKANQKFAQENWPGVRFYDDFNGVPNKCLILKTGEHEEAPEARVQCSETSPKMVLGDIPGLLLGLTGP